MENLKIKVNSEAESKEAQELFAVLGYKEGECSAGNYPALIIAAIESRYQKTPYSSRAIRLDHEAHSQYKKITLPQLRDLVVLKRNDPKDATHTDGHYNFYVGKDKNYFFSSCDKAWRGTWKNVDILKPIEKPMKEYLRKNSNGTYSYIGTVRPEHVSDFMIEIPEGATKLVSHNYVHLPIMFVKPCANGYSYCYPSGIWSATILSDIKGRDIFWSRHTLPEELPFIDDEPLQSLNEQYAEIEKVRQDIINSPGHYADSTIECIDAMEAMMTPEQFIGYLRGNVFKYQWRYEKKNGIEDLKKAQWYLDKLTVKVAEKNAPF